MTRSELLGVSTLGSGTLGTGGYNWIIGAFMGRTELGLFMLDNHTKAGLLSPLSLQALTLNSLSGHGGTLSLTNLCDLEI